MSSSLPLLVTCSSAWRPVEVSESAWLFRFVESDSQKNIWSAVLVMFFQGVSHDISWNGRGRVGTSIPSQSFPTAKRVLAVDMTRLWTTVRRIRYEGRVIMEGDIVFKAKCESLHKRSIPYQFITYGEVPGHSVIVDDAPSF